MSRATLERDLFRAALGVPAWICLPVGIVVLYLVVRFLGKSTNEEDLKKEAAQEAAA